MSNAAPVLIAIAQINPMVGDLDGNVHLLLDAMDQARGLGATLLLTPELALSGYSPEDLLLRPAFYTDCAAALARVAAASHGLTVVVGHPHAEQGRRWNAASVFRDGVLLARYFKQTLPNEDVFDEVRYFAAGDQPVVFEHGGVRFGLNICADVWEPEPAQAARDAGAEVLLVLNASPYHIDKHRTRHTVVRQRVQETGMPMVYANLVGGQDELVFDGQSFALNRAGELCWLAPAFEASLSCLTLEGGDLQGQAELADAPVEAMVYRALVTAVRDYVGKNGFPGVLLGLSGGIDSALTLAIAVDALGADQVHAVMMPSQYTADISVTDARAMIALLGCAYSELPIRPLYDAFMHILADEFAGLPADTTEENLQARARGTLLMALSNKSGKLVLTTGNKSEMSVGYATLYGDMAGGLAVLKDVAKTLVYRLAHYRNRLGVVIPERIITRPPSAELRPDQTDQDSLPPYEVLDAIMAAYVEDNRGIDELLAAGFAEADVRRVVHLLKISEHKRRQAPLGIRITPRGFGKDWRVPITQRYAG